MRSYFVFVTFALTGIARGALEVVPPTGQCSDNTATGHWWSCMSTMLGCQWDNAPTSCNAPRNDKDIGREFCNFAGGETLVLGPGSDTAITNGQNCGGYDPNTGGPYQWVGSQYKWKCCQCPAGYKPAGAYSPSQDGIGSLTYDVSVTGGQVEKTCMRCTGAGEVLTWNSRTWTWTCNGAASTVVAPSTTIKSFTTMTSKAPGTNPPPPQTSTTTTTMSTTRTSTTKPSKTKTSKTTSTTSTTSTTPTTMATTTRKSSISIAAPPKSTTTTTKK